MQETRQDLPPDAPRLSLLSLAGAFLRLGCVAFGGPIAHIGYLRAEVVERRGWLDGMRFGDLVALCQLLPGPASSQVVFGVGFLRAGWLGGLVASIAFTLPSALLMVGFAAGTDTLPEHRPGWLMGLLLAAVAVVAQAVWGMWQTLCPDPARRWIALGAASLLLALASPWAQVLVLGLGGLSGLGFLRPVASQPAARLLGHHRAGATAAIAAYAALLLLLPLLALLLQNLWLDRVAAFYWAGALVFGGGHVVLPLLRDAVVAPGWVAADRFVAGYGAAQALPGPLFSFAGYLGAAMEDGPLRLVAASLCLLAIFLPGWLLVAATLPHWHRMRAHPRLGRALDGANAAVVGLLAAALFRPLLGEAVIGLAEGAIALVALIALLRWKAAPWMVVAGCAAAGWLLC